jgi:hypothetical protein
VVLSLSLQLDRLRTPHSAYSVRFPLSATLAARSVYPTLPPTCRVAPARQPWANFRHGRLPQSRLRIAVLSATLARELGKHDAG